MNGAAIVGIAETCVRDSASLILMRSHYERAAASSFSGLVDLDERICALLECLEVQGARALGVCRGVIDEEETAAAFAYMWLSLRRRVPSALRIVFAAIEGAEESTRLAAVRGAGWAPRAMLRGQTDLSPEAPPAVLLASLEVCASHGVDPGPALRRLFDAPDPTCRARALRSAAEHGRVDLLDACLDRLRADDDVDCRRWAAWAAVLLGNRDVALDALSHTVAAGSAAPTDPMLVTLLGCVELGRGQTWLRAVASNSAHERLLIRSAGLTGDPRYVNWLITRMEAAGLARLAGEAFCRITGASLDTLGLTKAAPSSVPAEPNDDPVDENVALDPDDGLPWPAPEKVTAWWHEGSQRFDARRRYFSGGPVTVERCVEVLQRGRQRERALAAIHLSLLRPGTPLFNVGAPAWRQQRWLTRLPGETSSAAG